MSLEMTLFVVDKQHVIFYQSFVVISFLACTVV